MTASPTHPRTGEPETEAGRELSVDWPWLANVIRTADGNHDLGAGALAAVIAEALSPRIVRIEAEAAKRERDRIRTAVEAIPAWGHEAGCRLVFRWQVVEALGADLLVDPAEGSPDPVPDEPPGVDPFDSRDASHVDGLSGRERADLRDEPPGVATWMHGK